MEVEGFRCMSPQEASFLEFLKILGGAEVSDQASEARFISFWMILGSLLVRLMNPKPSTLKP